MTNPHIPTVSGDIAATLRLWADSTAGSIAMAEARGEDTDSLRERLDAVLQWERWHTARAKGVKAETLPIYGPKWPSERAAA